MQILFLKYNFDFDLVDNPINIYKNIKNINGEYFYLHF